LPSVSQELPPHTLTPESVKTDTARTDTTLLAVFRNSRIGFNSFVFANRLYGQYAQGRQAAKAELGQNFLYNKSLTERSGKFVQEDYVARLEYVRQTPKGIGYGFRSQSQSFRAIGNSYGRAEGLLVWRPILPTLDIYTETSAGVATDNRGSIRNSGASYRLFTQGNTQSADSTTRYFWQGNVSQAFINPRKMALMAGKAGLSQRLGNFAETRLSAGYLRRRVEDYLAGHIQSIVTDSAEASLFLGSQLGKYISFQSDNRILVPLRQFKYRGYDTTTGNIQNTRFAQTEVYSRQQISISTQKVRQTISVEYTQRLRAYNLDNNLGLVASAFSRNLASEKIKDIAEATINYAYQGAWQASSRTSFKGAYTGSLLRVNTPSELNNQDRDETFYTGELGWSQRWLQTLRSTVRVSGSLRNVLFLESTQSAQNYVERLLRLEPTLSYGLGRVRFSATYGLWATYNVRQFALEESKNRANRIWIQQYQARYQATPSWYFLVDGLRRENRIAQLNWSRFKESPIDTIVLIDLHLRAGHTLVSRHKGTSLSIEGGYKLVRQDRHNLAGVTQPGLPTRQAALHTITAQQGPSIALAWELPGRGRILLDSWLQWAVTRYKYRLSEQIFVGQTYTASQLNTPDKHLYVFFNLTGQLLLR